MKIDINLLPPEYRPKPWVVPLAVALIVAILAVGYFGYGFLDKRAEAKAELDRLQSQLDSVNAEIDEVVNNPVLEEYTESIAKAESELDKLEAMEKDYETYNASLVRWKGVIQTIRELAPSDVVLLSFEQEGDEITVEGELSAEVQNSVLVVEYARLLENRDLFSRVDIEIGSEERETGQNSKTEEIIVFVLLLEVKPGGL